MKITPCINKNIIKSIITEPTLWKVMYGQGCELKNYKVDMTYDYLLIKDGEETIGLFQTRFLTRMILECHGFILPKYWGTGKTDIAEKAGIEWIRMNTNAQKLFTDIPEDCKEVKRSCERNNWKLIGTIKNGVVYNGRLQELSLYEHELREVE